MSQPRYLQIVQQLRDRIQNGEYPPNTRIPTENELSVSMGVSRPTVRQALNLLEQEGRLTRVKGSGTYVTEPKIQHESTRFVIGYQEESRERHNHLHTSVLALQKEKPGKLAAKALGLAEGERVTRMVRLRWLEGMYNGCPIVYTTVYVPVRLFPEMEEQNFTDASFYEMLDSRGMTVMRTSQRLDVRMPPAEVAAELKLSPFEPTVYIVSTGYGQNGTAVEYSESYYPASRSSFNIEINRAVRKSRLRLWIKEEIFWHLSAISRQWPARTGKRCLKTLVGFLAVSARKMLFPLKLILRFRDRLTIKTASAFYKDWTNTMHCTAAICAEHSPKSAACRSKGFNLSMMQRPLRWGK